jgi:hypothetical protein
LRSNVGAHYDIAFDVNLIDPSMGEDGEIGAFLPAAKYRVKIGN